MPPYHIEKIARSKYDAAEEWVTDLHELCWPNRYTYWNADAEWWIAEDGNEPVAFAGLHVSNREGGGYLCRAGVHPKHRGHGLQRRLIQVRERWARKQSGIWYLVTDTIHNPISANNLIEEGFRMYDPITPWGSEGAVYWRKELA